MAEDAVEGPVAHLPARVPQREVTVAFEEEPHAAAVADEPGLADRLVLTDLEQLRESQQQGAALHELAIAGPGRRA